MSDKLQFVARLRQAKAWSDIKVSDSFSMPRGVQKLLLEPKLPVWRATIADLKSLLHTFASPLETAIAVQRIEKSIFLIRGERVMLDADLAALYEVTQGTQQAVRRNIARLPEDFMFQLSLDEAQKWWRAVTAIRLRSQSVTLKRGQHLKYRPFAFTEHRSLMLSSVLQSDRAVRVNVEIMRTFVRLREVMISNTDLARKLNALEQKYDQQFKVVFDAIRQLMSPPPSSPKPIGFRPKLLKS